ncbi:hypothetical protein CDAR_123681 [Caerostris darwini]|uniref:Uncharacterized protein n=1 Tax=Caerostris darwini TaxID=1538125 RepID=A0AAV4WTI9_9ARAC|nr:hypothetical protein CDAR_123681 [Caerostris darwini]
MLEFVHPLERHSIKIMLHYVLLAIQNLHVNVSFNVTNSGPIHLFCQILLPLFIIWAQEVVFTNKINSRFPPVELAITLKFAFNIMGALNCNMKPPIPIISRGNASTAKESIKQLKLNYHIRVADMFYWCTLYRKWRTDILPIAIALSVEFY